MPTTLFDTSKSVLDAYLHEHHMRRTMERETILRRICSYQKSFSADDLVRDVHEMEHISVATVYNTLDLLVQCHLLCRLQTHVGSVCKEYELVHGKGSKFYFVCTRCGREVEFKDKALEDILHSKRFPNFNMSHAAIRVYGTCKTCRKKPKEI